MNSLFTALTNIRRSPYQSLVAVLMVTITFFVGYVFSLFVLGTEQILRYFETRPQIIGFFEIDASAELVSQAQETMQSKEYVESVSVVTKEQALKIYQDTNQDDPLMLELVTAEILPASIEVSAREATALNQISSDLQSLDGIEEVSYQKDFVDQLVRYTTSLRIIGLVGVSVLAVTSLLTMIVITGMKSATKRQAINIMRMIGASKWYIQSPFIYEGLLYGLVGSLLGWLAMFTLLLYATPWLSSFLVGIPLLPIAWWVLALQAAIGSLIGMVFGALASSLAVQRVMRR